MTKAAHHRGDYHRRSLALKAQAYANPDTRCWRCGRTMQQVRQTKPRAKWTAGHLVDGQINGALLPECSPCNYGAGARLTNSRRGKTDLSW